METSLYLDPKNPRKKRPIKVLRRLLHLSKVIVKKWMFTTSASVFSFLLLREKIDNLNIQTIFMRR